MARYGMVIDTQKCIGCHVCAMACKVENNVPTDTWWNRILCDNGGEVDWDMVGGSYPDQLQYGYFPMACQHCENPACVKVCPVGATYKDPETGVVRQDYDKCIGCRMCMAACPYTGVRSLQLGRAEVLHRTIAVGDADVPAHQKHVVEKCTMCWHRIAKGEEPACVQSVPGACTAFWGDLDDPSTLRCPQLIREARATSSCLPETRHRIRPCTTSSSAKGESIMTENVAAATCRQGSLLARSGGQGADRRHRRVAPCSRSWASRSGRCSSPAAWCRPACATWTRGASTSPCSCSSWASPPAASSSRSVPRAFGMKGFGGISQGGRVDVHLLHRARHRLRGGGPGAAPARVGAVRLLQPGLASHVGHRRAVRLPHPVRACTCGRTLRAEARQGVRRRPCAPSASSRWCAPSSCTR